MAGTHLFFLWSVRGRIDKGDPDFTVYYTAAKILRQGRGSSLYSAAVQESVQREFTTNSDIRRGPLPYIHPPFEALIFVPLTLLPYGQAFMVWNLLNLGILVAIAALLRGRLISLRHIPLWEWVLALLAFFPVFVNFLQGQDAILLLLVFVVAFRALDRGSDLVAGGWLGLALFKFHFALPLVLILVIWRGRKLAAGFAATATAVTLLSLALVGWPGAIWQGARQYPAYAWRVVSIPGHGQTPLGLMPNLIGLATGWPALQHLSRLWVPHPWVPRSWVPRLRVPQVSPFLRDLGPLQVARLLALLASVALLVAVTRTGNRPASPPSANLANKNDDARVFHLSFACAVITSLLVAYNTNAHDLCLLVLPLALFADDCALQWHDSHPNPRKLRSLLLPVAPLFISPLWIFLWLRWEKLNLMVIPLLWWIYVMAQEASKRRTKTETRA